MSELGNVSISWFLVMFDSGQLMPKQFLPNVYYSLLPVWPLATLIGDDGSYYLATSGEHQGRLGYSYTYVVALQVFHLMCLMFSLPNIFMFQGLGLPGCAASGAIRPNH